ncbi:hypothetical protein RhiirA5_438386 [Rhizophagus irregularis]|uniref:RRM domain-containing protein n=1 Tax=Rhizophagus irregularis TaxID=588596 RepID=A0A2N0NJ66_9GLOM|nr:hypothetical protein RhiirA5_438386 [Rhizophagus irregularis]
MFTAPFNILLNFLVSSDYKKTFNSSLESPHQDESNGDKLISVINIDGITKPSHQDESNGIHVITSPHNTTTPVETVDASIHAPSNTSGKGKAVAFEVPECQPSPDGNAAAIKSTPSRYHAAAYLRDAPDAIVPYDFTDCVNSPRADLLDLAFTHYSPADAKLSDEAKSLFVTDIPLFLNEMQVRQEFSCYGTVIKCKLTPKKHYYNGHIQFSFADAVTQFNDIWAIICLGNSLRVCLASFSKSQRDSRREHVAILAGIPKNIKEADLLEIATQVNAKALNVPLSISSYKPKPYVVDMAPS